MPLEILSRALNKIAQGISSSSSSLPTSNPPNLTLLRHGLTLLRRALANISTVPTYSTSSYDSMSFKDSTVDSLGSSLHENRRLFDRPHYTGVSLADFLSMLGSLAIIIMVPKVVVHVPSQKKRMLLILFTAMSNFGFSMSNIISDLGNARSRVACTIAVWCYVFFQLLTSTLVIVATFRLCGIFLFKHKHTVPSKFIIFGPVLAFILATTPAIAGQFHYDTCGRYCWFIDDDVSVDDCKLQSVWAWACFYGWMVLFLGILFASTLFVLSKIAIMVMATRSNVKKIVNQSAFRTQMEQCTGVDEPQRQGQGHSLSPHTGHSTLERIRTMSHTFTSRAVSFFSFRSHEHLRHADEVHNNNNNDSNNNNVTLARPEQVELDNALDNHGLSDALPVRVNIGDLSSFGLDSPTLRSEGILGDVLPTANPTPAVDVPFSSIESGEALRARERPFVIAIFRQALYPISISLSGCVQIFVDLTMNSGAAGEVTLGYAANFITSIQGFLFFVVFFFDPAVVKTRRHWRKYMVWKYYVEFYFSMGMLQEGNDFEVKFMEHCQKISTREHVVSWLMKPPSYSWSNQYDYDAMAPEFLTGPHFTTLETVRKLHQSHMPRLIPEEETEDQIKSRPPISGIDLSSAGQSHYFDHLLFDPRRTGSPSRNGKQKFIEPEPRDVYDDEALNAAGDYTPYTYDHLQDPSGSSSSSSPNNTSNENRVHPMTKIESTPPKRSPFESITEINLDTQSSPSPRSPSLYSVVENSAGKTQPKSRSSVVSLSATNPGDVLALPHLTRVRTIGGSDGTGRFRSKRPSKTSMSRATTFASSKGRSLAERLRFTVRGDRRNLMSVVESYQSAFRWPRGAYVMHLLVRWIMVPASARLPAIKRPPFGEAVIQERKTSVDMIRSGGWNPSCVIDALRKVMVQPKKEVPQATESMSSSPEGGSMEVEMLRVPLERDEEGSLSNSV